MKKAFLLPILSGLMLTGCAGFTMPAEATNDITTYLVLSKIGQYSGDQTVYETIPELFLENTVEFKAPVGAELPGKDVITATSGVEFLRWVSYDGEGAPTTYTHVPAVEGKILYAYFAGGQGSGGQVDPGQSYTLYFRDAEWWNKDKAGTMITIDNGSMQLMNHIAYVSSAKYNYWSAQVPESATKVTFSRYNEAGTADWGAATVEINLAERGEHDMYDISGTTARWKGDGNYVTGVWTDYDYVA